MNRRATLDPIFSPLSVAVVGASRRRDSIGFSLVHNLLVNEFAGAVFPINPGETSIHSLKCYPNLAAVPDDIDLAVIAVPKRLVETVVDDAIAKQVRGLVVITAGFGETGAEGAVLERRICEKVRAAGLRMIGPNCMGVINADPRVRLNATFAPIPANSGSVGFVSQSGALGVAILNVAGELGIGLTQFVSMGNKADVSGNDLLEYWEHDDATRVIAMYLESFGNPRNFTEIAKRVGRIKPILVVKSGRTTEGARAASSHTGALAGADVTVSAFLEQCGVLRAESIADLFDIARALDRCPLPAGRRVAILTNAGGPAIMATDACVNLGLEITELSEATRAELKSFLPPEASIANPVDMIASASAASYHRALSAMLADDAVDMVIVINVTPLVADPRDVMEQVSAAAKGYRDEALRRQQAGEGGGADPAEAGKPVLAVMMASEDFYAEAQRRQEHPPVYRFPEPAVRALAMLARYAAWRRRPIDPDPPSFEVDDEAVAALLTKTGSGYLDPRDAFRVLELYGIPVAASRLVAFAAATATAAGDPSATIEERVAAAAAEIGYPVAIKADAPDLVHKSDIGGVALGIEDEAQLRKALSAMLASLDAAGHVPRALLVQRMVAARGQEVIFGISTDPRFGPLLMFGLGGKYVEVLRDVRFAVTPLSLHEAEETIRGIRGAQLLDGVRGEPPADVELLVEVLLRLAQLAQRHPAIRELDINPFLAAPRGQHPLALDVRIKVAPETDSTDEEGGQK
jgi:acetyl coenzyme A synthetase (ADP forming)-like protein